MFRNADLRDVSLPNLRYIEGGVRIAENDNLCFVDTINWAEISTNDADILIEDNHGWLPLRICLAVYCCGVLFFLSFVQRALDF